MEQKKKKFSIRPPLEKLEVYLLAADNPIGKRQLRPIFRRKRNKKVLTREQVVAIKRGRRVLRNDMKERGIKRLSDFDEMATNLGLFFDRKGLLWPLILWFSKGNTAMKILATTAVLTTVMTVTEYVTEYITEYITEYLTEYVTEYKTEYVTEYVTEYLTQFLDKDRFTISLSDKMMKTGFELSEKPFDAPDFDPENDSKMTLSAIPVTRIPCISIAQIPYNIDEFENNSVKEYFTYTFYCRYIDKDAERDMSGDLEKYAVNYDWGIRIHTEGINPNMSTENEEGKPVAMVSDAVWVMVIQDGEVILCAKADGDTLDADGNMSPQMLPTQHILETQHIAFRDRSFEFINDELDKIYPGLTVDDLQDLESIYGSEAETVSRDVEELFNGGPNGEPGIGVQPLTQLMLRRKDWREDELYKVVGSSDGIDDYYQVVTEPFVDDELIVERTREGVKPWVDDYNEEYHKYTVVIWLEGDDPQCTNELMEGFIGLNFQIKSEDEVYVDTVVTPSDTPPTTGGNT